MSKKVCTVLLEVVVLILSATGLGKLVDQDASPGASALTGETAAHVIDVGQGDSILLLSGEQAVLVDAGTSESGDVIIEYLKSLGIEELYAAVATHPHADHIGSMWKVIDEFPIEYFYMGREQANTKVFGRMLDSLEARSITPTIPEDGDTLLFDSGASLTFLGPADDVSSSNLNNRSLVCRFDAGGQTMLLTGDAEAPAEKSLLQHHPDLSCDILKVGHHGSDTSSSDAFLEAVQPTIAVISCGIDNDYGHPSPETLEKLAAMGISDVRITAESGTIVLPFESENKENAA